MTVNNNTIIEARQITKAYNNVVVLDIPNLKILKEESFGLIGNNGAGKTTFFSLIVDIIRATNGSVLSKEIDVKMSEHWKEYTGSYLDESFIISFLTPEEYFEFIGKLHGFDKEEIKIKIDSFSDFFNGEILGKKKLIRELSKGNQKKVGIAGALIPGPEVLILDEPFPHLDPSSVIRLKKMLKEMNEKGVTLLISSHDLNHVTEVCNRIVLLEKGKVINDIQTSDTTLKELENYFAVQDN